MGLSPHLPQNGLWGWWRWNAPEEQPRSPSAVGEHWGREGAPAPRHHGSQTPGSGGGTAGTQPIPGQHPDHQEWDPGPAGTAFPDSQMWDVRSSWIGQQQIFLHFFPFPDPSQHGEVILLFCRLKQKFQNPRLLFLSANLASNPRTFHVKRAGIPPEEGQFKKVTIPTCTVTKFRTT